MKCQIEKLADMPLLDIAIIKNIPWAENMWVVLKNSLRKTFLYWCHLVLKLGENEDIIKGWADVFIKTYEETCLELVSDMELVQNNVLSQIEQLLQEFEQICQTLRTSMPVLGDSTRQLTLRQEQQELMKYINEYQKLIQLRHMEINELNEKQLGLCTVLGTESKTLKSDPLPSIEEIEDFKKYIEKLESIKLRKFELFLSVKAELIDIIEELNREPSSEFEKNVFSSDNSVFLVTDENMKKLEILRRTLINEKEHVRKEIAELRKKLDDNWNLLSIELKEREDFQKKHRGNSLEDLQALQTEIIRCDALKKDNIKVFIDKLRQELGQLWDKCHCSQIMRSQFEFFYTDYFTEGLLNLHEIEIAKWKKYHADNKELLTLIEKHQCLWKKMINLEENTTGPNRFNNRGGQLLKEEKERNKLAKQIPQLEEMLCVLADKYKQNNNIPFTTFGSTIPNYLAKLHEKRDNIKKQKPTVRIKQQTPTPTKTTRALLPTTSCQTLSPSTSLPPAKELAKPADDQTQDLFPSKSDHILSSADPLLPMKIKSTEQTRKLKARNIKTKNSLTTIKIASTSNYTKRYSTLRKKRVDRIRRISSRNEKLKANSNEVSTDYLEFQNELSSKHDSRSTLVPTETPPTCTPKLSRIPIIILTKTNINRHANMKHNSKTANCKA